MKFNDFIVTKMVLFLIVFGTFISLSVCRDGNMLNDSKYVVLPADVSKIILLPAGEYVILQPENSTTKPAFHVCQAHSQVDNVILSSKAELRYDTSVQGRDVGMVTVVAMETDPVWYLYSNTTHNTRVLVHLTFLTQYDPLPGGCNEEFELENDPNIHTEVKDTSTTVEFQWSNTGYIPGRSILPTCEDTTYQSYLSYHGYVRYIRGGTFKEQDYFDNIKMMLTASDIMKHGTWLRELRNTPSVKSMLEISSYKQQGVIYAIVVKSNKMADKMAAYIPVVNYGCDIQHKDHCEKKDVVPIVFATVGAIVGLFLCFFGHRFFKTENFIFGFLIFGVIFYQLFTLLTDLGVVGTLGLSGILGVMGGVLLLALWWNVGVPILNVLFIALVPGYLLSSVLFYTPFANLSYWDTSFNYGATFTCGVLIGPVIMLFFTRFLSIFSCVLIGSYLTIVPLDTYLGSGMRNIILNSLRHGTDRGYVKVIVTGPFTQAEISLTVVWIVLFICGLAFQIFRERKKAPFPPCPRDIENRSEDLRRFLRPQRSDQASSDREQLLRGGNAASVINSNAQTEREALLGGAHQTGYGTSQNATESSEQEVVQPDVI